MGTARDNRGAKAFSLLELLCVVFVIALLAALLLPALNQARAGAKRISCVNHLREIGVAFHSFAHEHDSRFPMALPSTAGGALEFVQNGYRGNREFYFAFRQFQALSNELVTPNLLLCPADSRVPAADFQHLRNANLSYFVGVTAEYFRPNSLLAGDRNLTNDLVRRNAILTLGPYASLRWTRDLHRFKGNLLFADGRVAEKNSAALAVVKNSSPATDDLFLPATPLPAGTPGPAASVAGPAPSHVSPAFSSAAFSNSRTNSNQSAPFGPARNPAEAFVVSLAYGSAKATDAAAASPAPSQVIGVKPTENGVAISRSFSGSTTIETDAGFALFPTWVSAPFHGVIRNDAWLLLLFLILAAVVVLILRKRLLARAEASSSARTRMRFCTVHRPPPRR